MSGASAGVTALDSRVGGGYPSRVRTTGVAGEAVAP